jgi:hypothetical protein
MWFESVSTKAANGGEEIEFREFRENGELRGGEPLLSLGNETTPEAYEFIRTSNR